MAQTLPKSFKAAVIEAVGQPFTVKDFELRHPGPNEVLVKVIACGVCHTDGMVRDGGFGPVFPRIPGRVNPFSFLLLPLPITTILMILVGVA